MHIYLVRIFTKHLIYYFYIVIIEVQNINKVTCFVLIPLYNSKKINNIQPISN